MSTGCSNHGCWVDPPKGMGTNGICHCLDQLGREKAHAIMAQLSRLRRLETGAPEPKSAKWARREAALVTIWEHSPDCIGRSEAESIYDALADAGVIKE